jgi:6,7-dimethyl-8-ribityllumazine synthase
MAEKSKKKNLSDVELVSLEKVGQLKIGVIVSEWNAAVTDKLFEGCKETLLKAGIEELNIKTLLVPGAYELPFGAKMLVSEYVPDAIVCIGCVIKGETSHNEYINHAVAQGLTQLSLFANTPIIFSVLTPDTMEQALDRAGGKQGNKGVEAAATALKMIHLKQSLKQQKKQIGFG